MSENFIEVYENALPVEICKDFIDYFEKLKTYNLTFSRQDLKDSSPYKKQDTSAFLLEKRVLDLNVDNGIVNSFLSFLGKCYQEYTSKYSIIGLASSHGVTTVRLQKTLPGEGYHLSLIHI